MKVQCEQLRDAYYGMEVQIGNNPKEVFSFTAYEVIDSLRDFFFFINHYQLGPPLEFRQISYPVKCTHTGDFFDVANMLLSGKNSKMKNLPAITIDIGGRKISLRMGGNRYSYDMGILPCYTINKTLGDTLEHPSFLNKQHSYYMEGQKSAATVYSQPNEYGPDSLKPGLADISYPEILTGLQHWYGREFSIRAVIKEMRNLLKGNPLSYRHSTYLPVLTSALFISEVARNPICMSTGLMLLDLIEAQAKLPEEFYGQDYFRLDNVLWNEADEEFNGGFHPMTHTGSFSEEFNEDTFKEGRYNITDPLLPSHFKSFFIFIEWARRYLKSYSVRPLSKEEFTTRSEYSLKTYTDYFSRYARPHLPIKHEWEKVKSIALGGLIRSIGFRLHHFDCMVSYDNHFRYDADMPR